MPYESPRKRPRRMELGVSETLDFVVDWGTFWLEDGDALSTSVWSVEDGLTVEDSSVVGGNSVVTLSWDTGTLADPLGKTRKATVTITTTGGRTSTAILDIVGVPSTGLPAFVE